MARAPGTTERRPTAGGALALCAWCCALALVWLVVLPWWARRPAVQAHLDWLRVRQIDPSAMYYTELEAMKPILRELEVRKRDD